MRLVLFLLPLLAACASPEERAMKLVGEHYDLSFYEDGAFAMACKTLLEESLLLRDPNTYDTLTLMPDLGMLAASRVKPKCAERKVMWRAMKDGERYLVCYLTEVTYSDKYTQPTPEENFGCFEVDLGADIVKTPSPFPSEAEVLAWRAFFQLPLRQYRNR